MYPYPMYLYPPYHMYHMYPNQTPNPNPHYYYVVCPVFESPKVLKEEVRCAKSDVHDVLQDSSGSYKIRMGNWEEMYDLVNGTKTWYNTVTKKTTKKDPFV